MLVGFICKVARGWVAREIISGMKILQWVQNDVVVKLNDAIRIAHCALNNE